MIDRWQTEMSGRGVFYARRNPKRALARHEVLAGLTRYLVAYTSTELIRLAEEQHRIEERLNGRSLPVVCSHCGRDSGNAPSLVTMDESSVTAERCAHEDVEWTYQRPLPDGARCRNCSIWWRLDLIPAAVASRLKGGTPAREDTRPSVADRRRS